MTCCYCDKKYNDIECEVVITSIETGWPYNHCKEQEIHKDEQMAKTIEDIEKNWDVLNN